MKLVSLNVALFEKNNEKLEKFIAEQRPDILCLQEVTKRVDDFAFEEFVSKDSIDRASTQLARSFFAPIWVLNKFEKKNFHGQDLFSFDPHGNIEFGNYVKSRFPITKGQNIFVQNHFSYITDWSKWPEEDYRAVEVVDVELQPGKMLRVLNYHGIWSRDKRGNELSKKACERIKALALEVNYPSIICGDFNLFPDTESIQVFGEELVNLPNQFQIRSTRPSSNELNTAQRNVVDYILVTKNVKVKHFEVIESDVSDHLPLILDFDL